jgi:hypothetical protein
MLFHLKSEDWLDALQARLSRDHALTPDVVYDITIVVGAAHDEQIDRVDALIQSGAFTDAALALIELVSPGWKLRRLSFDDGEWHCLLSRHPGIPAEFDDTADGSHEIMQLAILSALIEALRHYQAAAGSRLRTVPPIRPTAGHPLCCDNFV